MTSQVLTSHRFNIYHRIHNAVSSSGVLTRHVSSNDDAMGDDLMDNYVISNDVTRDIYENPLMPEI